MICKSNTTLFCSRKYVFPNISGALLLKKCIWGKAKAREGQKIQQTPFKPEVKIQMQLKDASVCNSQRY